MTSSNKKFNFFKLSLAVGVFLIIFLFFWGVEVVKVKKLTNKVEIKIGSQSIMAEVAKDDQSRVKGLGGRSNLGFNEGMLFVFPRPGIYGFWMKDMLIPIDIIWINNERIVGWEENLLPPTAGDKNLKVYYPPEEVNFVLELPAGKVKSLNLKQGEKIFLRF